MDGVIEKDDYVKVYQDASADVNNISTIPSTSLKLI